MTTNESNFLDELERIIKDRSESNDSEKSYTRELLSSGSDRIAKKVIEESGELAVAYLNNDENKAEIIWESADLLYHMMVLLRSADVTMNDISRELEKRHKSDWIMLDNSQIESFKQKGFLVIRNFFNSDFMNQILNEVNRLDVLEPEENGPMKYYEESQINKNEMLLIRIEKFIETSPLLKSVVYNESMIEVIKDWGIFSKFFKSCLVSFGKQ